MILTHLILRGDSLEGRLTKEESKEAEQLGERVNHILTNWDKLPEEEKARIKRADDYFSKVEKNGDIIIKTSIAVSALAACAIAIYLGDKNNYSQNYMLGIIGSPVIGTVVGCFASIPLTMAYHTYKTIKFIKKEQKGKANIKIENTKIIDKTEYLN